MTASTPWLVALLQRAVIDEGDAVRIRQGTRGFRLSLGDLRALLLSEDLGGPGAPDARLAALDCVTQRPEYAPSIIHMHAQLRRLRPPWTDQSDDPSTASFRAQASFELDGRISSGQWATARTKKDAGHLAHLSLLAALAGMDPTSPPAANPPPAAGDPPDISPHAALTAIAFLDRLRTETDEDTLGALADHAAVRAHTGLLTGDLAEHLLFSTQGPRWEAARTAALAAAARHDGGNLPLELLQRYADIAGLAAPRGTSAAAQRPGHHTARSVVGEGDSAVHSPACEARTKDQALLQSRLHLLAILARLPFDGVTDSPLEWTVTGHRNAIAVLHQMQQRHTVRHLNFRPDTTQGVFSSHASCIFQGHLLHAEGTGRSKSTAKLAAAEILLLILNHHLPLRTEPPAGHVPAQHPHPVPAEPPAPPAGGTIPQQERRTPPPPPPPPSSSSPEEPGGGRRTVDAEDQASEARLQPRPATAEPAAALEALQGGCDLLFAPDTDPLKCAWLLARPQAGQDTDPDAVIIRDLLLPGGETIRATCWRLGINGLMPTLLGAPAATWSASTTWWAQVVRLGLEAIATGAVYPAFSDTDTPQQRQPHWRTGPLPVPLETQLTTLAETYDHQPRLLPRTPHDDLAALPALRTALDTLADHFVPPPSGHLLSGPQPFLAPVRYDHAPPVLLQEWTDTVQDLLLPHDSPPLVLSIAPPATAASTQVIATLQLTLDTTGSAAVDARDVWDHPHTHPDPDPEQNLAQRVCRALRRAGRHAPALRTLGMHRRPDAVLLSLDEAAALLGPEHGHLKDAGITVVTNDDWSSPLDPHLVIGLGTPDPVEGGQLGIGELLDRRWQFTIDGTPLTEQELDILADAALPFVRIRNRWIVIDATLRSLLRTRRLPSQPRREAILSVLHGSITVNGRTFACRPAEGLAHLIEQLTHPAPATPGPHPALYPYQAKALTWLDMLTGLEFGGILADDMGLGKTVTAIAFHLLHSRRKPGPTLVLCPKSVVDHWKAELARHAPDAHVVLYRGPDRCLPALTSSTVVVTTYPLLVKDHDELKDIAWGRVIADEAQYLKNPGTQAARCARSLSGARIALTGTPLENEPAELWALLDWANPGLFATRAQFNTLYTRPLAHLPQQATAPHAVDRFQNLIRPFIQRRLKTDPTLGLTLPPKTETTHLLPLSREQIGLCEALLRDSLRQIQHTPSHGGRGTAVLSLINGMRKICISPAHYLDEHPRTVLADPDEAARRAPKLAQLHHLLHQAREQGESALVFTTYAVADKILTAYLTARGFRPLLFDGELTPQQRTAVLDTFNSTPAAVLVLTPQSGGVGLDLTHANHVIHYNRLWNPAAERQASDRAHRIGQKRPVTIHHLVTANSIEERITALLHRKTSMTNTLLPNEEFDPAKLDATELIQLCSLTARP
ncbi:DEAD/DEAH box helicase [Streptomyces microflavus]|uniref:DEAD/DEAH box helicase n=1 Tax=Streptomyces microflavus TaxID=1919 RepID=UPI0034055F83